MKKKTQEQIVEEEFKKAQADAKTVWENAAAEIQEPEPLLHYRGKPALFKNTVNLIQGQTGCHKSRLALSLVSLIVSNNSELNLLGFSKAGEDSPTVVYADTERNINYQLPIAIRQLLNDSGLDKISLQERFRILPLTNISRIHRSSVMGKQFKALSSVLKQHYVIVLDIASDFIVNFNDVVSSMQFIDMINTASNSFDITFIVILHENPGGEKARGHLGTELSNKSSTIFQISQSEAKDVFKVKMLKSRSTEKYEEVFLKFDPTINNLRVVDDERTALQASDPEIIKLGKVLGEKIFGTIEREDLFKYLLDKLKWSERKIHDKLSRLISQGIQYDTLMGPALLVKKRGKTTEFEMVLLDAEVPSQEQAAM